MKKRVKRVKQARNILLTLFLIWEFVVSVIGLLFYLRVGSLLFSFFSVAMVLDVLGFIGFIVCIIAAWKMKQWGIYGIIGMFIYKFIEGIVIGTNADSIVFMMVLYIVILLIDRKDLLKNFRIT